MTEPVVAQKAPYGVEVESGKTYFWCACGKSSKQPFCDGSHSNGSHSNGSHSDGSHSDGSETHSEFAPMKFEAEESKLLYFCGCKASQNKPFCDGSHKKL
ncbi:MAG: CDGSH iron-sulfur domain-containing protein [Pseudomonadales bacterium]|nr:glutamate synthase [Gammaproteobacteria bacterium]MDP6024463.1 CDGSH iron-sulfur domain-containing protein [Pseudomonadales bacterium]MDP6316924.1 CDGSH iron-sulfur domain-containing protein [Pseudomonadales bacterium]